VAQRIASSSASHRPSPSRRQALTRHHPHVGPIGELDQVPSHPPNQSRSTSRHRSQATREISPQEEAAARSSLSLLNVPQTALGLAGAGEFAGARLGEVARGEEERAFETTEEAAEQAVGAAEEAVRERPFETAGAVAGSLALSGGLFGAASRIGPRAGGVTRAAIQPGEELIGQVGGRTTRAVAGERAAERLFPQNEPVFLSEETVLRGVERGVQAGVDLADRTTVRGFGAGFPALEVETEQEREEPEDFRELDPRDPLARPERNERLRERARFRGRDRTDLGPNRRGRARRPSFETEIESEIESRTQSELADLRVQSVIDDIVTQTQPGGRFGVRELPRTDQAIEPAAETEPETRARAETRTERPVEVEPIELEDDEDEDRRFFPVEFEGVREIEAIIDPTDLEVD